MKLQMTQSLKLQLSATNLTTLQFSAEALTGMYILMEALQQPVKLMMQPLETSWLILV